MMLDGAAALRVVPPGTNAFCGGISLMSELRYEKYSRRGYGKVEKSKGIAEEALFPRDKNI